MNGEPDLLIGGQWRRASDGGTRDIVNPADGSIAAVVDEATPDDARDAVAAARKAFDDGQWPATPVAERAALADLEGGCLIPMAAWARDVDAGRLGLDASVLDADGRRRVHAADSGPIDDPRGLGLRVAASLRAQGAAELLRGEVRPSS